MQLYAGFLFFLVPSGLHRPERSLVGLSTEAFDERVASLFQSDYVLPRQYLEAVCRKTHQEAEQGLMFAVLEDAVTCFQKYFVPTLKTFQVREVCK